MSIELENCITLSGEMHGWGEGCNPACAGGGGILGLAQAGHGDIFTDGGLRNQDVDAWVALTLLGETRVLSKLARTRGGVRPHWGITVIPTCGAAPAPVMPQVRPGYFHICT